MTNKKQILIAVLIVGLFFIGAVLLANQEIKARDMKIVPLSERLSYLTTEQFLAAVAAPKLEAMILAAEKDGMCLIVLSGYRTHERQQYLYDFSENKELVAKPGTSEHEKGLAVDLGGCPMIDGMRNDGGIRLELRDDFVELPEYQWLLFNAHTYGFEQSYTENNYLKTGIIAEPWHWRYNY